MEFVKFKDGSRLRSDTITAVQLGDATVENHPSRGLKPRVIVDFVAVGHGNCIIIDCETVNERDSMADSIMAEIEAANE